MEGVPAVRGPFEVSRRGAAEAHEIEAAIACDVEQLLTGCEARGYRQGGELLERSEAWRGLHRAGTDLGVVALVEPRAALLGKHAGQSLAVEIDPAIAGPVD